MKKSDQSSPSETETIEATAAAWLAQRDDGLNATQMAEFARWHEADPRHAAALARLEETWALLGQLREYRPEARMHPDRDLLAKARPALVFPMSMVAASGLLAAALTLAAVWWWVKPTSALPEGLQQYATTTDGYQLMTLTDGSVVQLNADSKVRVNYTPAERRVRLVKGEAHFTVAKHRERPFRVEVGAVTVRAVGTAFNVRLDATKIEVLVTEGKVEVDQSAVYKQMPAAVAHTMLEAGQRLVILPEKLVINPVIENIALPAMRDALDWQDSRLVFSDTPLADVVEQFNKHNRVQIELADTSLQPVPVGGSWRAGNVEAFVRMLASDASVVVDRPAADRIVLRRAR